MVNVILMLQLGHGYLLKNMYPGRLRYGQMKYLLYFQLLRLILAHSAYCAFVHGACDT